MAVYNAGKTTELYSADWAEAAKEAFTNAYAVLPTLTVQGALEYNDESAPVRGEYVACNVWERNEIVQAIRMAYDIQIAQAKHAAEQEQRIAALEAALKATSEAATAPAPETAKGETVTITTTHYMAAIRNLREALRRAEYLGELEIDDLIGAALTNLDPTFYAEPPF